MRQLRPGLRYTADVLGGARGNRTPVSSLQMKRTAIVRWPQMMRARAPARSRTVIPPLLEVCVAVIRPGLCVCVCVCACGETAGNRTQVPRLASERTAIVLQFLGTESGS